MANRRVHSKISRLPPEIRLKVEKSLINGVTYSKIAQYLQGLGYDIDYACVYRYSKPFLSKYEKIVKAKEQAKAILAQRKISR